MVLKQANYKCQHCGVKHRQHYATNKIGQIFEIEFDEVSDFLEDGYKVVKMYLQVAHVDNDPANCSPGNLLALCPRCHAIMDKHWRLLRRLGRSINPFS